MKPLRTSGSILVIAFMISFLNSSSVFAQEKSKEQKVRSLIVTEEKLDEKPVRNLRESETRYDQNGNIIETIGYKDGKVDTHFKYEYDAENNKIKEIEYDKSGEIDKVSKYVYKNGLRIEKSVFDKKGNLLLKKTYQYTFF